MAQPSSAAALDRSIALYRQQSYGEARAALEALLADDPENVTAWNVLGYLEGDIGEATAAAAAFDHALALRPGDPIALKGRARMALERAETDVLRRYAAALRAVPGDRHLILEQTEARLAGGDETAIDDFALFAGGMPAWTEGQIALARMRLETRRDDDYAGSVRALLMEQPRRPDLWQQFVELLSGCDLHEAAADAARDARAAGAGGEALLLREAVEAGWAGDLDRAERLFAALPANLPGRAIHDAVHQVRRGGLEVARASIERALAERPADIDAWAIAELIYRALGDPRAVWLSGQAGLVRTFDLPLAPARLEAIRKLLHDLHRNGVQVVGQSVREGTQTRWRLLDRLEPELAELKAAIKSALADYLAGLPPRDDGHPLLRHRDAPLTITGSWSVRLSGGGHHISHVHPKGLISSACYFEVPDVPDEGCLELGRPPAGLLPGLSPLHVIAPRPGQLTLFPSYLHHGTTRFAVGRRLAVAFDVNRRRAPPLA